jgi:uncharacterized protein
MTGRLVVLDTNVLVSAVISSAGESPPARLVEAVTDGHLRCLVSRALVSEYRNVLLRDRVSRHHGLVNAAIDRILLDLVNDAVVREPAAPPVSAPDPNDNHLWALLAAVPRAVLVTGDKRLINEAPKWASVVFPRTAAEWFIP